MSPPSPESCTLRGLVIYFWGREEQDRLLRECFHPALAELRNTGELKFFWFDRFGARGPHLFFVFDIVAQKSIDALCARVTRYLAKSPSSVYLSEEELQVRHQQCRGKILCAADRRSGIAPNNSFVLFEQPEQGYPFNLSEGLAEEGAAWRAVDDLYRWIVQQVAEVSPEERRRRALIWAVTIDRELAGAGLEGAQYWGHHAETLWIGLRDRGMLREEGFRERSRRLIGEKNLKTLSALWHAAPEECIPHTVAARLVKASLHAGAADWNFLREVNHWTLKNLGLPVHAHLPVALFGWQRTVSV